MNSATEATSQIVPEFFAGWTAQFAKTQQLNKVWMDSLRRLAEVRAQAGADAFSESCAHMVAIAGSQDPGAALAGWPSLMQSAFRRQAQAQQEHLDIWASALQATTKLMTEDAGAGPASAAGSHRASTGAITERRIEAVVIRFPDRRAAAVHGPGVGTRANAHLKGRVAVAHR